MTKTLTVRQGDHLAMVLHSRRGGMAKAVAVIQETVGKHIGSRATFGKLLTSDDVSDLDKTDRLRLWLLLVTIGEDPAEWGLSDKEMPLAVRTEEVRNALTRGYGADMYDLLMVAA